MAEKSERLLNLYIMLLAQTRFVSKQDIRRAHYGEYADSPRGLEAFEKAFERDKEDLRELGVVIEVGSLDGYFDDEQGYRISPDTSSLPEIRFEADEAAVLGIAARAWEQHTLARATTEAMRKLAAQGVEVDTSRLDLVPPSLRAEEPAFDACWEATQKRRVISFDYRRPGEDVSHRRLQPWGVVRSSGRWYVVGHDLDRRAERVFRLSRVQGKVSLTGKSGAYDVPPGTDVKAVAHGLVAPQPRRRGDRAGPPAGRGGAAAPGHPHRGGRRRPRRPHGVGPPHRERPGPRPGRLGAVAGSRRLRRGARRAARRRGRPAARGGVVTTPKPAVHAAREQVGRLLALVPYLHQHGEVRISEAAEALGVDAEQLDKDLRVLFMCGLPGGFPDDLINVDLDALEGEGIIRVDNADYLARPVRFAPSEAAALVVALRAIEQSASAETRSVVARTLSKLETAGAASAAQQIHVADETAPGAELLPVLLGAIERGHQLEIAYYVPSRDEQTTRIVEPRAITRVADATYLDAWCHTAHGDRAFRVDRIVSALELADEVSEHAAEPRDLSGGWFRGDGETVAVTLRLQPDAQWVPEYYPVTDTAPGPDGTLDVVIDVASEAWLHQLLFRVAPHASVISPREFAEGFTADVRATVSLYQDGGVG